MAITNLILDLKKDNTVTIGNVTYTITVSPLAEGSFGSVYIIQDKKDDKFVLKVWDKQEKRKSQIPDQNMADRDEKNYLPSYRQEKTNLDRLGYLIDGEIEINGCPALIMEHFPGKSLIDLQDSKYKFTQKDEENILKGSIQALVDFYRMGYLHGDIKPDNILYDPKTEKVSFIDFGTLLFLKDVQKAISDCSMGYTPEYAAPEILDQVNSASDLPDRLSASQSAPACLEYPASDTSNNTGAAPTNDSTAGKSDVYALGMSLAAFLKMADKTKSENYKLKDYDNLQKNPKKNKVYNLLLNMTHSDLSLRINAHDALTNINKIFPSSTRHVVPVRNFGNNDSENSDSEEDSNADYNEHTSIDSPRGPALLATLGIATAVTLLKFSVIGLPVTLLIVMLCLPFFAETARRCAARGLFGQQTRTVYSVQPPLALNLVQ